jgi:hypothetical protein
VRWDADAVPVADARTRQAEQFDRFRRVEAHPAALEDLQAGRVQQQHLVVAQALRAHRAVMLERVVVR